MNKSMNKSDQESFKRIRRGAETGALRFSFASGAAENGQKVEVLFHGLRLPDATAAPADA